MKKIQKTTIGTRDKIDIPEFELTDLPCRIDTGATTSAIHCHQVKLIQKDGQEMISFCLLDPSHDAYNHRAFKTSNFTEKKIKSSFGDIEYRYTIKCPVTLFDQTFMAEFTLADREKMKFPVLLGRRLLKGRFIVDVAKANASYKLKVGSLKLEAGSGASPAVATAGQKPKDRK